MLLKYLEINSEVASCMRTAYMTHAAVAAASLFIPCCTKLSWVLREFVALKSPCYRSELQYILLVPVGGFRGDRTTEASHEVCVRRQSSEQTAFGGRDRPRPDQEGGGLWERHVQVKGEKRRTQSTELIKMPFLFDPVFPAAVCVETL